MQIDISTMDTDRAVSRIAETTEDRQIHGENTPVSGLTDDEMIDIVAARILKRFKPAFEELAK